MCFAHKCIELGIRNQAFIKGKKTQEKGVQITTRKDINPKKKKMELSGQLRTC